MKAKLNYTVRTTRAPGETRDSVVPVIVERLNPVELETVVENCIDRGLVAGLKPTAAHGIAEGVAAQIAKEFSLGRGVQFGQYFYGRPYLSGTVDANGRLTSANGINVRLYKGAEFGLRLDDFSLTFDGAGDAVKVGSVYGDTTEAGGNTYGQVVEGAPVKLNGRNLYAAGDADKVTFAEVGGGSAVEVTDFATQGADMLSFAWPTGLVAGRSYRVAVERTDVNGVTRTSAEKTVSVVAAATPPEPEPIAQSSDGKVKVMSAVGGGEGGAFTPDEGWTLEGEGLYGVPTEGSPWILSGPEVSAGGASYPAAFSAMTGVSAVVTMEHAPGEAGEYDAELSFSLTNIDPEVDSETLTIPIRLVVA